MTKISVGGFKDRCLQIRDQVAETRTPVVVTKRGRPVATVMPYPAPRRRNESLVGSVLHETDDACSTGEGWDADRAERG
jgi:antitoxin (DNA-binding transcriptional repressor) of toxin-antitoxin stability system